MLAFLEGMKEEAIYSFRRVNMAEPEAGLRAEVVKYQVQCNLANLILELPRVIQEAKDQINQNIEKKMQLVNASEGGKL